MLLLKVGKVKEAHGIKGELYILVFSKETPWLEDLKNIHLRNESSQESIELEIGNARRHKSGFILRTETIKDRNRAEELKGWEFYLPKDLFVTEGKGDFFLCEIENFQVIDENSEMIGVVSGFASTPGQDLMRLRTEGGDEFLVPLVDRFIVKVDREREILQVSLPDGLLEPEYAI